MTRTVLLGDITTKVGSGATPRGGANSYLSEGPFTLIRSQNVRDGSFDYNGLAFINEDQANKLKNVEVSQNDVLVNITGDSVARVGRVPKNVLPARVNQHVAIIRPDEQMIDSRYLYYSLVEPHMNQHLLTLASTGATRNALTKTQLEKLKIELPDLETQKKIADVLGMIDEKIELNRQMNETLEQMGQALFRHYFIDNPEVEKWEDGTLQDILNVTMGQSPPGSSYNTVGDGTVFYQGRAEFDIRFPNQRLSTINPKRLAKRGDVLLSVRAPVGDINQATENCCVGRGLAAISSIEGLESYCYYLMKYLQPRFADFNSEGTVFGAINGKQLKELKVTIPPVELRQKFDDAAKSLDAQIWNSSEQIQTLTTLRDTLLPRLINGKVKV